MGIRSPVLKGLEGFISSLNPKPETLLYTTFPELRKGLLADPEAQTSKAQMPNPSPQASDPKPQSPNHFLWFKVSMFRV